MPISGSSTAFSASRRASVVVMPSLYDVRGPDTARRALVLAALEHADQHHGEQQDADDAEHDLGRAIRVTARAARGECGGGEREQRDKGYQERAQHAIPSAVIHRGN